MITVRVTPKPESDGKLRASMMKLERAPRLLATTVMPALITAISEDIGIIFARQGPNWHPLAPITMSQRIRLGFSTGPILVRTGYLRGSLTEPGAPDHVAQWHLAGSGSARLLYGTRADHFIPLQYGVPARNLPARPMLPVDYPDIQELLEREVDEAIQAGMEAAVK